MRSWKTIHLHGEKATACVFRLDASCLGALHGHIRVTPWTYQTDGMSIRELAKQPLLDAFHGHAMFMHKIIASAR
jgi:hypothetical protein